MKSSRFSQSFQENEKAGFRPYPEEFPIYLTHNEFPGSAKALSEMEMPLGMVARPLIDINYSNMSRTMGNLSKMAKDIARCCNCGAYINPYCDANNSRWYCSICGKRNTYSKAQVRYRSIDHKLIPEFKDLVIDYEVPITSNKKEKNSVPLTQRPLIHVFLIQENMKIDTMQTTIDAITSAISNMHPDMNVMLMTYSHRIGVFNLKGSSTSYAPIIQYAHFLTEQNEIFESSDVSMEDIPINQLKLSVPLHALGSFLQCAERVADCRDKLDESLNCIFETLSSNDHLDERQDIRTLLNVLDAINEWMKHDIEQLNTKASANVNLVPEPATVFNTFDFSKLLNFLPTLDAQTEEAKKEDSLLEQYTSQYYGIQVHIFADAPQHPIKATNTSSTETCHVFQRTISRLVEELCHKHVCCNLFSVISFATKQVEIWNWWHFIHCLGGEIYRITLGNAYDLEMEKLRFIEILQRIFSTYPASKIAMKLRIPKILQITSTTIPTVLSSQEISIAESHVQQQMQQQQQQQQSEPLSSPSLRMPAMAAAAIMDQKVTAPDFPTTEKKKATPERLSNTNEYDHQIYHFPMLSSDTCYGFRFHYREHLSSQDIENNEFDLHHRQYPQGSGKYAPRRNSNNGQQPLPEATQTGIFMQLACAYEQVVEQMTEEDDDHGEKEGVEPEEDVQKKNECEIEESQKDNHAEEKLKYLLHTCQQLSYKIPSSVVTPPLSESSPPSTSEPAAEEAIIHTTQTVIEVAPAFNNMIAKSNPLIQLGDLKDTLLEPASDTGTEDTVQQPAVSETIISSVPMETIPSTPSITNQTTTMAMATSNMAIVANEAELWEELITLQPSLAQKAATLFSSSKQFKKSALSSSSSYSPQGRKGKRLVVKKFIRIITIGVDCSIQATRLQQVQQYPTLMTLFIQEAILASSYASFYCLTHANPIVAPVVVSSTTEHDNSDDDSTPFFQILKRLEYECIYGHVLFSRLLHYLGKHYNYYLQSYRNQNNNASHNGVGMMDYEFEVLDEDGQSHNSFIPSPDSASKDSIFEYLLTHHKHVSTIVHWIFAILLHLIPNNTTISIGGSNVVEQVYFLDEQIDWWNRIAHAAPPLVMRALSPQLYAMTTIPVARVMKKTQQQQQQQQQPQVLVPVLSSSLPLRRDAMMFSQCTTFLLDSGHELVVYYTAMASSSSASAPSSSGGGKGLFAVPSSNNIITSSSSIASTNGNNDNSPMIVEEQYGSNKQRRNSRTSSLSQQQQYQQYPKLLPMLYHRFYEHPNIPRVYTAQAGSMSAGYFTAYFIDDPLNTTLSYPAFVQLLADMIVS